MSTSIIDDDGSWKVPQVGAESDRTHAARVKLLQAGLARLILAIPSDATPRSRAIRIGQAKNRVSRFYSWMCEKYVYGASASVRITDTHLSNLWGKAYSEAVNAVIAALDAGEDVATFLCVNDEGVIAA